MIRKFIILLSLCCLVLCAFVGFLSKQAIKQEKVDVVPASPITCAEILKERPKTSAHLLLNDFVPCKYLAHLDFDGDGEWDLLCVPFLPTKLRQSGHNYKTVLVCFKGVPNEEALMKLLESSELETNYWPLKQQLDKDIQSLLAHKYKSMVIADSPVLYHGFEAGNPVLGETSLMVAVGVGTMSVLAIVGTLIAGLFVGPKRRRRIRVISEEDEEEKPTTNLAGLPTSSGSASGGGVLDRVKSMRKKQPGV